MSEITEDEFFETYDPIELPEGGGHCWEYEQVIMADIPVHRVWSLMDGDDGADCAAPGFHVVNVYGYMVATHPWTDEGICVVFEKPDG